MAANIRPKNNQDAFDKVLKAIRKQNYQRSATKVGSCKYRGPNGLRCAAGHLIPNNLYRKSMEGKTINSRIINMPTIGEYFKNVNSDLLSDLQSAHDRDLKYGENNWETGMKQIAKEYNLVYTEPSKEI